MPLPQAEKCESPNKSFIGTMGRRNSKLSKTQLQWMKNWEHLKKAIRKRILQKPWKVIRMEMGFGFGFIYRSFF